MKTGSREHAVAVRCLINAGLPPEHLKTAIAAISTPPKRTVRLTADNRERIASALANNGRCVVVLARGLGVRVYTLEGYTALRFASSERATRDRLWDHRGKNRLTKQQDEIAKRLEEHEGNSQPSEE